MGLLPLGLFCGVLSLGVAPEWISALFAVAMIAAVALPLGFLVAIAFYQFLDIDRLFSATLSYSILTVLALAVVLGVMPAASRTASDDLGLDPVAGQLLVSLGLAAVLPRALDRAAVDHPLPAACHADRAPAVAREISTERTCSSRPADGRALTRYCASGVVVLYARAGDGFTPRQRAMQRAPAFAAGSPLIAALQERTTPLAARRWTVRRTASLTPFERAAIETLDVAVLVPIRRGADLAAFWCLGAKRSGDIYTPTDLALLGAVAGAISDRLLALGETRSKDRLEDSPRHAPASPDAAASPPLTAAAADDAGVFRREGEYWTVAYRGKTARLRDTKGLYYIARLLAQPGRELHVRDLATMNQQSDTGNSSEPMGVEGDLGTILDARATAQYKQRLAEARQELDETTAAGDLGQAARARHEIETITEQLAAAYGLGGRLRTAGDPAERVRKAVTNQIRRTIDRISAAHPELGRHLTNALRTGFAVRPPQHPVAWRL